MSNGYPGGCTQHDHDRAFDRPLPDENAIMARLEERCEYEMRVNHARWGEWCREYCDTRDLALLAAHSFDLDTYEFNKVRDRLLHDYTQYRAAIAQGGDEWQEIADLVGDE